MRLDLIPAFDVGHWTPDQEWLHYYKPEIERQYGRKTSERGSPVTYNPATGMYEARYRRPWHHPSLTPWGCFSKSPNQEVM